MSEPQRKRKNRSKRRADGELRPTIRRRKQRLDSEKRQAWFDQFEKGARARFFGCCVLSEAIFLRGFVKATGMEEDDAAAALERIATERHWLKLRIKTGKVVGIAPPRPGAPWKETKPRKETSEDGEGREI